MDIETLKLSALTGIVLESAFRVSNALGSGFLEKVYENSLVIELRERGLAVMQQAAVDVLYRDRVVGQYVADLIVESSVVIEVKAVSTLQPMHESQCINYLKATRLNVCMLLNFGRPRVEYRRIVWSLS
jgi:GxxExxY protein